MTATATYISWEEAATAALVRTDSTSTPTEEAPSVLAERVDQHLKASNWQGIQHEASQALTNLGRPVDTTAIVALLASKQHDYGHDNIDRYGLGGVEVRISDKVCRLKNLLSRGADAANESLIDTWLDLIGYATIARMLQAGTFSLPLSADVKRKVTKLAVRSSPLGGDVVYVGLDRAAKVPNLAWVIEGFHVHPERGFPPVEHITVGFGEGYEALYTLEEVEV